MEHSARRDVSLRLTAVCVINERGRVVSEGKVASEPPAIADFLQPYADTLALAGLEASLLAPLTAPGVGTVVALAFRTTIDLPAALSPIGDRGAASGLDPTQVSIRRD